MEEIHTQMKPTPMSQEDKDFIAAYEAGDSLKVACADRKIDVRRGRQILQERGVPLRQEPKDTGPISPVHFRLGNHLMTYSHSRFFTCKNAADKLGVSMKRYAALEKGQVPVDILELQNIADYTKTPLTELMEIIFAPDKPKPD